MSTARDHRPTWAEIDRGAFGRNIETLASGLPSGVRLIAVLKGDAYGHGAVELAKLCKPDRVAMIATALLEESLELRRAGIDVPLLVLGPLSEAQIRMAVDERIAVGIVGPEELEQASRVARDRDVTIHLKFDTGMGRMGVTEAELPRVIEMLRSAPRLRLDAVYTHFANADDAGDPLTGQQIEKFHAMSAQFRGTKRHLANSAATLRGLTEGDYVRVGVALFGAEVVGKRLEAVLRWRTEVSRLKDLPKGHGIGYGTTFHTQRPSRIATLPVGYADGYGREFSNNGEVLVRGRRAPIVGRVSMDLVTIDVTDIPEVRFGDEVVLLGGDISVEELARRAGTISYEVFCRIGKRVPRVYK